MRTFLLPAVLALAACASLPNDRLPAAERLAVRAVPVPLDPADPSLARLGRLRWLGGVALTSGDRRFGGLSALRWRNGALIAASDEGDAFALTPREVGGRLVGIADVRIRRFAGPDGRSLPRDKAASDIESLELDGDDALISLETDSTIWRYRLVDRLPAGAPEPVPDGEAWRAAQSRTNGGVEAQAIAGSVRLMVSEQLREADGSASALVIADGAEQRIALPLGGVFVPTDLVTLDADAHVFLLLQRNYRKGIGTWMRLARFALERAPDGRWRAGRLETLATLGPPLTSDNMEGLALRREGARTILYMISDDNFSKEQRTLLMKWELAG